MFFGKSVSFVIMMGISGPLTSSLSFIHTLWIYMLQVFGMYWVMLDLVVGLLVVGINGLGIIPQMFGI